MTFTQNKIRYKYLPKYFRRDDELKENQPTYVVYRYGAIKQNDVWKNCRFYILSSNTKTILEICPIGIIKEGMSNLGPVNDQGLYDKIELTFKNQVLFKICDLWLSLKIMTLKLLDKVKPIKSNLSYITFAFLGSCTYYVINYYFDNFLQKIINNSNLAQSIIVFLSLSSIINIFHPFTLRREINITDIDDLIKKKEEIAKAKLEHEVWVKKHTQF